MKKIKIAAGLAHVDYGHLADIVKEATEAGADYIHSDAADMHDLKNMQLMGGHQIIEGIWNGKALIRIENRSRKSSERDQHQVGESDPQHIGRERKAL